MESKSEKKLLKQEIFELGEELQKLYNRSDRSEKNVNSSEYQRMKRMIKQQQGIIEKSEQILEKERKKGILQENEIDRQRDRISELEHQNLSLREKFSKGQQRLISKNLKIQELMKNTTLRQMELDQKVILEKKLEESEKSNMLLLEKLNNLQKIRAESPTRNRQEYLHIIKDKNIENEKLKVEIINLETKLKHRDEMIRELQNQGTFQEDWKEIMAQNNKTIELQKDQILNQQLQIDTLKQRFNRELRPRSYQFQQRSPQSIPPFLDGIYYPRFLKNTSRFYSPETTDNVDVALAQELNRRQSPPPLVFERQSPGVYYYGLQKVFLILKLGNIFVKSNGRVLPLNEFLEQQTPEVQSRELQQKSLRSSPILKQFYGISSPCHE